MHIGAAICFALALFFYSFADSTFASGLVVLGVLFEILAWVIWASEDKKT